MNMKEVYFDKYCATCKHNELEEKFDPCNECLEVGARENTQKPIHYISKEGKTK